MPIGSYIALKYKAYKGIPAQCLADELLLNRNEFQEVMKEGRKLLEVKHFPQYIPLWVMIVLVESHIE